MQGQEPHWMTTAFGHCTLFALGVALSVLLWVMTWKRINGFWSISWRMYITTILTAGIPWFSKDYSYVLFWPVYAMTAYESFLKSATASLMLFVFNVLVIYGFYWIFYMGAFQIIRWCFRWRQWLDE